MNFGKELNFLVNEVLSENLVTDTVRKIWYGTGEDEQEEINKWVHKYMDMGADRLTARKMAVSKVKGVNESVEWEDMTIEELDALAREGTQFLEDNGWVESNIGFYTHPDLPRNDEGKHEYFIDYNSVMPVLYGPKFGGYDPMESGESFYTGQAAHEFAVKEFGIGTPSDEEIESNYDYTGDDAEIHDTMYEDEEHQEDGNVELSGTIKSMFDQGKQFTEIQDYARMHGTGSEDEMDALVYDIYNSSNIDEEDDLEEGYYEMPPINRERYDEIPGLEGPFQSKNGHVYYYDPKEGMYYDRDTDMYISYDEWQQMNEAHYTYYDIPDPSDEQYYQIIAMAKEGIKQYDSSDPIEVPYSEKSLAYDIMDEFDVPEEFATSWADSIFRVAEQELEADYYDRGDYEYEVYKDKYRESRMLGEKSKSKKQAKTMTAACKNAEFRKKVGIPKDVACEFHKEDKGTYHESITESIDEYEMIEVARDLFNDYSSGDHPMDYDDKHSMHWNSVKEELKNGYGLTPFQAEHIVDMVIQQDQDAYASDDGQYSAAMSAADSPYSGYTPKMESELEEGLPSDYDQWRTDPYYGRNVDAEEEGIENFLNQFDLDDYLKSHGSDFGYQYVDELTDEEKTYSKDEIVSSIEAYLDREYEIYTDGYSANFRDDAEQLFDAVVGPRLASEGYIFTDAVSEEMLNKIRRLAGLG